MREITRVEDTTDADGYIIPGYIAWQCDCGTEIRRYRGQSDQSCGKCGQWYNSGGQRLRNDWMGNSSNWDEDVSDLDGYEIQHAGDS